MVKGLEEVKAEKVYVKCTWRLDKDKNKYVENDFVLALLPPQFKTVIDTFLIDSSAFQKKVHLVIPKEAAYVVVTKKATKIWKYLPCLDRDCLSHDPELCVGFTLTLKPEESLVVRNSDLLNNRFVYEKQKMIRPAYFELSDRKFESIQFKNNEVIRVFENKEEGIIYIKFKAGYWRDWREMLCSPMHNDCEPEWVQYIILIKRILTKKAYYNGPMDSERNDQFMDALIRYQRDHNLPMGQIDINTLMKLGLR